MNAAELIEHLTRAAEDLGVELADLPVLVADQPAWPLTQSIAAVTPDPLTNSDMGASACVWLATGPAPRWANAYAPRHAWDGELVEYEPERGSDDYDFDFDPEEIEVAQGRYDSSVYEP